MFTFVFFGECKGRKKNEQAKKLRISEKGACGNNNDVYFVKQIVFCCPLIFKCNS